MKVDISKLSTAQKAQEGSWMEVLHPTENTPIGVKILLAGSDSDVYLKTVNKNANKRRSKFNPARPSTFMSVEEQEADGLAILVACTLDWKGMIMNGKDFPFSSDNCRKIYGDPGYSWIKEQVDRFIHERANFLA